MPPKKKKGKGKKKKKKDGKDIGVFSVPFCPCDLEILRKKAHYKRLHVLINFLHPEKTELTVEDKYKRTLQEIECLRDELASRTEITRRAKDTTLRMKEKMLEAQETVEVEKQNKLDISSDLTRQYKTMQSEMALRIHMLEQTVTKLRDNLAKSEEELRKTKKEFEDMRKEKDHIIAELKFKIEHMESVYESILHDAFDRMAAKVEDARGKWQTQALETQEKNKQLLLEFGLNPLEI